MDAPMHDVVASLPLAEDIREALVQRRGRMGQLLDCVVALETGEDDPVLATVTHAGELYLEALMWANARRRVAVRRARCRAGPGRPGQGQLGPRRGAVLPAPGARHPARPPAPHPPICPAAIPSVAVPRAPGPFRRTGSGSWRCSGVASAKRAS